MLTNWIAGNKTKTKTNHKNPQNKSTNKQTKPPQNQRM